MHLGSLNADVLFHLIKFVDPVDSFNLVLSGILKGFDNLSKVINVEQRISNFHIKLRPCRDRMGQLEIRSLQIYPPSNEASIKCCEIFERLVEEGFFKSNRELTCYSWSHIPRFLDNICSMRKLDKLKLYQFEITLDQLSTLFRSCPDLVELSVDLDVRQKLEMDDCMKNDLRRGFQKLKLLTIHCLINDHSWPAIIEIVTWLKECVELKVYNCIEEVPICVPGSFSTLNPTLAQNLQSLTLDETPADFIRLILPSCFNINTLNLGTNYNVMDAAVEIDRLKKLKKLRISGYRASDFTEILRNCHQVEILKLYLRKAKLKDITEWAAENLKEVELGWDKGPSIKQVLPVLVKWRQLRKVTFPLHGRHYPSSEVLCDFIMRMKHLKYLDLSSDFNPELKPLLDKINEFVLPRRPNFHLE